uniref:Exostosin GT47 domain-containing protein n=1 Tax=Graphocephala atropunctata TaxID=36148 RepID=A0A1B6KEB4_9HEMI
MCLIRKRVVFLFILCLYCILFLALILYWMYTEHRNVDTDNTSNKLLASVKREQLPISYSVKRIPVEIWGKASLSLYLWQHILKGPLNSIHNGLMKFGNLTLNSFEFSFKNGGGYIQTTVPENVQYLVLVLNGRSPNKVKHAKEWLEYLKRLKQLKKVCLVLLGSEQCENDWILSYMGSRGGKVDVAFLVYDSPLVDNKEIFQWPLGVAEYRGFPDFGKNSIDLLNKRPFIGNFVGTVYKNSSRESMVNLIKRKKWTDKILLIEREEWIPNETVESRQQYIEALQSSDLTLSPAGMNTECYRIYEALALGSVPVVEDIVTPGKCAREAPAPLRLLKQLRAPVIWLSDWANLSTVLHIQQKLSFREITNRRIKAVNWYINFKKLMKRQFLEVLSIKFDD